MDGSRTFDILVFGATGFTGRLVCEYLNQRYGINGALKWGMAARSADKLASVRDELGLDSSLPLVVADSNDKELIDQMVASTRVILTTAGPYQQYGTTVVESCARLGTDYVDLSGESLWSRDMDQAYGAMAAESGARILFSCGFDSLPSDLGVHYLQEQAIERLGRPLPRVRGRVQEIAGTASGGTIASFTATMAAVKEDPALFADLTNPFVLTTGFQGPEQPTGNEITFDEDLGTWAGPFVMATINSKNVHRSNQLLGHRYGENLVYDEMLSMGTEKPAPENADQGMALDMTLKPGEGPTKEQREAGFYDILYIGTDDDGNRIDIRVKGDMDPGYGSTAKMIAEAAVCLAETPNAGGGCFTAAAVMGAALRKRLHENAGVTFEVESA
ncbi:MAG: saccharopine dehydrogenase NADP-binding domain-containing protein [Pseudomonadota bacterium]